jgi:phage terminase small subunit
MKSKKTAKKTPAARKQVATKKAARATHVPSLKPLTAQQAGFVSEYLKDRVASKAAVRAGYSEKTAQQIGYQLASASFSSSCRRRGARKTADRQRIHRRSRHQGNGPPRVPRPGQAVRQERKAPRHPRRWTRTRALLIVGIEIEGTRTSKAGETAKVKLADKTAALRMAAQHFGLLKEHVEVTGKDGGPIETRELTDPERAVRLAKLAKAAAKARSAQMIRPLPKKSLRRCRYLTPEEERELDQLLLAGTPVWVPQEGPQRKRRNQPPTSRSTAGRPAAERRTLLIGLALTQHRRSRSSGARARSSSASKSACSTRSSAAAPATTGRRASCAGTSKVIELCAVKDENSKKKYQGRPRT